MLRSIGGRNQFGSLSFFLPLVVSVAVVAVPKPALGDEVLPSDNALLLEQIDFRYGGQGNSGLNSAIGQMTIDISALRNAVPYSSGYVNVADNSGNWIVRNLPIMDASVYDHSTITTKFNLGVADGSQVSWMNAYVDYSPVAVTSFGVGSTPSWSVSDVGNALGGFIDAVAGYVDPLDLSDLSFVSGGAITGTYQTGHMNVQTAQYQCAPMSVANSLQWLEEHQGINVQHDHVIGIKGDDSLVGKLDTYMDRWVHPDHPRTDGAGLNAGPILEGKLEYASLHDLEFLVIKHQGMLGGGDVSHHGLTSHGQGAAIDIDWIITQIENDEDVEMGYSFGGGGHFVEITGAGRVLGLPWITYRSDHQQSDVDQDDPTTPGIDETDTRGTDKIDFTFLWGNGMLFEPGNAEMAFVISQSIPEPTSLSLLTLGVLVLIRRPSR